MTLHAYTSDFEGMMPTFIRLAAAMLVLPPALAIAQQTPNPLDPSHPVPETFYQSVFERYQSIQDEKKRPDSRWVSVNQQLMPKEKSAAKTPTSDSKGTGSPAHQHGGH